MQSTQSLLEDSLPYLPNLPGFRTREVHFDGKRKTCAIFHKEDGVSFARDPHASSQLSLTESASVTSIGRSSTTNLKKFFSPQTEDNGGSLSFSAYFQENSSYSSAPIDATKVRRCFINYYIETSEISVYEKPKLNSGVTQGKLVKRSVLPKEDGNLFTPEDFQIGGEVVIFGRIYKILDCDAFTRQFYLREYGTDLGPPIAGPSDPYESFRKSLERGPSDNWGEYRSKKNQNKTFMEASLGNTVNNKGREGYIRFGNRCLKFRCVWDNTNMLYGDRKEYMLSYFLSDDTIEIISIQSAHSSGGFSKLLKRSQLPLGGATHLTLDQDVSAPASYRWTDFDVGVELNVYARCLRIVDADSVTRNFYIQMGKELSPAEPEPILEVLTNEREIPPPTGFGSEEDSMRSVSGSLLPGPLPAKKLGQDKVLAFFCKLLSGGPDDEGRRFTISYYVQDATLKIQEPPMRNSGFTGGVFLSRRAIKTPDGDAMTERHLYIGCKLRVYKHLFQLLGANESTLRWMEDNHLPRANFYAVMDKLRKSLISEARSGELARKFQSYESPENGSSKATLETLRNILDAYNMVGNDEVQVCEHEILTILRANGNKTDTFNYQKIIEQIISPTDEFK